MIYMKDENKKANRLNFPKGSRPHYPSQTNGNAKIKINSNTAIPKFGKFGSTPSLHHLKQTRCQLPIVNC